MNVSCFLNRQIELIDDFISATVVEVGTKETHCSDSSSIQYTQEADAAALTSNTLLPNVSMLESMLVEQCLSPICWRLRLTPSTS